MTNSKKKISVRALDKIKNRKIIQTSQDFFITQTSPKILDPEILQQIISFIADKTDKIDQTLLSEVATFLYNNIFQLFDRFGQITFTVSKNMNETQSVLFTFKNSLPFVLKLDKMNFILSQCISRWQNAFSNASLDGTDIIFEFYLINQPGTISYEFKNLRLNYLKKLLKINIPKFLEVRQKLQLELANPGIECELFYMSRVTNPELIGSDLINLYASDLCGVFDDLISCSVDTNNGVQIIFHGLPINIALLCEIVDILKFGKVLDVTFSQSPKQMILSFTKNGSIDSGLKRNMLLSDTFKKRRKIENQ